MGLANSPRYRRGLRGGAQDLVAVAAAQNRDEMVPFAAAQCDGTGLIASAAVLADVVAAGWTRDQLRLPSLWMKQRSASAGFGSAHGRPVRVGAPHSSADGAGLTSAGATSLVLMTRPLSSSALLLSMLRRCRAVGLPVTLVFLTAEY